MDKLIRHAAAWSIDLIFEKSKAMTRRWISHIAAAIVAVILLQTLYFKFTAHPDSVFIFTKLHMEPTGRIMVGVMELLASLAILRPTSRALGAVLAAGVLAGAIFFHLAILGINVNGDGGKLFALAVVAFIGSCTVAWIHRREIPFIGHRFVK